MEPGKVLAGVLLLSASGIMFVEIGDLQVERLLGIGALAAIGVIGGSALLRSADEA